MTNTQYECRAQEWSTFDLLKIVKLPKQPMEIRGETLRILKYLNRIRKPVIYGKVAADLGIKTRDEAVFLSQVLLEAQLAESDDQKIWTTVKGNDWLENFSREELNEIHKTLFENFNLSLLKYMYDRNEPINLDELPSVFSKHAPPYGNTSETYALMHQMEFGELSKYVSSVQGKNNWYILNNSGKHLVTEYLKSEQRLAEENELSEVEHKEEREVRKLNKQELELSISKLLNENIDYQSTKTRAKNNMRFTILVAIVAIASLIVSMKSCQVAQEQSSVSQSK